MARDICSLHHTEWDPTATVSVAALGATLCIWFVLIGLTSIVGGVAAWKRGLVYYVSYSLALLGLLMLLVYSILWEMYWDEATPNCVLPESLWIFIVIGFPLALIPPLLINWRIVCLYVSTYDITGHRVSPMHQRNRGTAWLLIRFCVLISPSIVMYVLVLTAGQETHYAFVATQALMCALLVIVAIYLLTLRGRMAVSQPQLMIHTVYMCAFSLGLAVVFVVKTVTFYAYPQNQIAGDTLDMTVAISIFLLAVAVLFLWAHYLTTVGKPQEQRPAQQTGRLMSSDTIFKPAKSVQSASAEGKCIPSTAAARPSDASCPSTSLPDISALKQVPEYV